MKLRKQLENIIFDMEKVAKDRKYVFEIVILGIRTYYRMQQEPSPAHARRI